MRKFLFNLKKINIQLFLIFLLILIFSKQTEFFKNFYDLIYKSHNLRQQEANDFCNYFGTGYIFYIKKKFNLKKST